MSDTYESLYREALAELERLRQCQLKAAWLAGAFGALQSSLPITVRPEVMARWLRLAEQAAGFDEKTGGQQ